MTKPLRVVNFFAGPGTGKSTTATALFAELKYQGYNTEYVSEYAKDATWERRGEKVFKSQEYIFGKQHFRLSRVAEEVDFVITDSPVLLAIAYTPSDYYMPSLIKTIKEAHDNYESINILLERSDQKAYNPAGRNQTEAEAREKDVVMRGVVEKNCPFYYTMPFGRVNPWQVIDLMFDHGWIEDVSKALQATQSAISAAQEAAKFYERRLARLAECS